MKMQRKFKGTVILIFTLFIGMNGYSQQFIPDENAKKENTKKGFDPKNLFFGGQLGFQWGTTTMIALAPEVGYKITPRLAAGIGVSYFYLASSVPPSFSTNIYGGKVFAYSVLYENAFVYGEYELLSLETKYFNYSLYPASDRFNIQSFLVGPGYRIPLGKNSFMKIMILWNLTENAYSPYSNPVYRLNFEF